MRLSNLSYALIAVVLVATAGLFMLFKPEEPAAIFYFNMGLTLLLEAVLLVSGFIAAGKAQFTVQGIAVARQIARYTIFMFVSMGVFAIIGITEENIRWYYASLVAITVIFVVLTVVTVQGTAVQTQTHGRQAANTDSRRELGRSLSRCVCAFSSVTNIASVDESAPARKALTAAAEKAAFIKAKAFSDSPETIAKIEAAIAELSRSVDDLAVTNDTQSVKTQCRSITEKAVALERMIDMTNQY